MGDVEGYTLSGSHFWGSEAEMVKRFESLDFHEEIIRWEGLVGYMLQRQCVTGGRGLGCRSPLPELPPRHLGGFYSLVNQSSI